MLTEGQIKEFQKLYRQHFGEKISREEAIDSGESLVEMIQHVYKPITREEYHQQVRGPSQ
jgi:urease accessory protein UreF